MTSGERPSNLTPAELHSPKWTIDTLYIHFLRIIEDMSRRVDERFQSGDRRTEVAMAASEKAISKAESAYDKRFELLNESRLTIADQNKEFARTSTTEALNKEISMLTLRVQAIESRGQGLQSGWGILVAALTVMMLVAGVLVAIWKK